jgi:AcrR family transcriptional regulator
MTTRRDGTRERIVSTAYSLFMWHGLSAVGVDRVVAEAGVAKSTLYRHFPSKDELVLAVLERRDQTWTQGWLRNEVQRRASTPGGRMLAIFDALDEWFNGQEFEGSLLINSMLETHDHSSPVRGATVDGLSKVRAIAHELAEQTGARDPDDLAHKLQILISGSIVAAEQGYVDSARRARDVAALILDREGISS